MKIKAIIFGATGMVGEGVLLKTLEHEEVESVLIITRKPCFVTHPKLKKIIHNDFFNYSEIENQLTGYNACFFCLGVSSVGMNEKDYSKITYDLTMQAAKVLVKNNPSMTFCYVSGAGTDSTENGELMWARVKGKTENHLTALPFKAVYLFRPGFMKPVNGQVHLKISYKILGHLYPLLKFMFPGQGCKLEEVGIAMIQSVRVGYQKNILGNKDIVQLAKTVSNQE